MSALEEPPTAPKVEPYEEEEFSDSDQEPDGQNHTQEPAQVQKRKGGRKPIYATSEERKQRNRQAQAAFRERRTEYIKQLETTIKHHEETLQSLQQSHRSAADECLMLRYKNSLLERILLEKGIDVQAELRLKTEGSNVLSHPSASAASQSSAVQRAVMNRNSQARRSTQGATVKPIRPQHFTQPPRSNSLQAHAPSPLGTAKPADGNFRPMLNEKNQRPQPPIQPRTTPQQSMPHPNMSRPSMMHPMTPTSADGSRSNEPTNPSTQPNFYPPEYQAHLEQLEQEYDAHANMLEDENPSDTSTGPGSNGPSPYPQGYRNVAPGTAVPLGMQGGGQMNYMPVQSATSQPPMYGVPQMGFDPNDPALDADPFGLTASMHFPTQFTYQEQQMRR